MIKNLLLSSLLSASIGVSALPLGSALTPITKDEYLINYNENSLTLGFFDMYEHSYNYSGGGAVTFFRVKVAIPRDEFDRFSGYDNTVYISIPFNYYNPNVDLTMSLRVGESHLSDSVIDDLDNIPLDIPLLAFTGGFTVPYVSNRPAMSVFNPDNWDWAPYDVYLTIQIPYIPNNSQPPGGYVQLLKEITIFRDFISDDYTLGFNQGSAKGYGDGYNDGKDDGLRIGEDIGFSKGLLESEGNGAWGVAFTALMLPFSLLSIELFPGVTLGMLALIPIVFGVLAFIFKIGGKK